MSEEPEVELQTATADVPHNADAPLASTDLTAPPGSWAATNPADNIAYGVPFEGAKFCGSGCDYRQALIIIAIISICMGLWFVVSALAHNDFDDDDEEEGLDDYYKSQVILSSIHIVTSLCALVGALKFNIYLVAINLLWHVVNFVVGTMMCIYQAEDNREDGNMIFSAPLSLMVLFLAAYTAFFMYPHIGFIVEVRSGIMSREKYAREICCCWMPCLRR